MITLQSSSISERLDECAAKNEYFGIYIEDCSYMEAGGFSSIREFSSGGHT